MLNYKKHIEPFKQHISTDQKWDEYPADYERRKAATTPIRAALTTAANTVATEFKAGVKNKIAAGNVVDLPNGEMYVPSVSWGQVFKTIAIFKRMDCADKVLEGIWNLYNQPGQVVGGHGLVAQFVREFVKELSRYAVVGELDNASDELIAATRAYQVAAKFIAAIRDAVCLTSEHGHRSDPNVYADLEAVLTAANS
jgi:hypothetical protein